MIEETEKIEKIEEIEVLSPAGSHDSMSAALKAGADAVYFGLDTLNARRGAVNFTPEALKETMKMVHSYKAKAYLTLNIDIAERELGHAFRMLAHAESCGVDGVIVRDPALMNVVHDFPDMEFHLSTQTSMSSSADIQGAKILGVTRVVLARELTLEEITKASSDPAIETEVFCQGAMCFAFSGRCNLSSWGGGKSGNRGTCASPCRVPWTVDGKRAGRPLSSHDLAFVKHVPQLAAAGVSSLKIEGRLKQPDWVSNATSIYRRAADGHDTEKLFEEALGLGNYTGRKLMSSLLDGKRKNLTACSGRDPKTGENRVSPCSECDCFLARDEKIAKKAAQAAEQDEDGVEVATPFTADVEYITNSYNIDLNQSKKGIELVLRFGATIETIEITISKIRRPEKALLMSNFMEELQEVPVQDSVAGEVRSDCPEQLLMPKVIKNIYEAISNFMYRQVNKRKKKLRFPLPDSVQALLDNRCQAPENNLKLGDLPNTVRIQARDLVKFVETCSPARIIVENAEPEDIANFVKKACKTKLIIAIPQVFFEEDTEFVQSQVKAAKAAGCEVEANNWGGVHYCRKYEVEFHTGYGLPVLNSLTAKTLSKLGSLSTTYALEADKGKFEGISEHTDSPLNLVVFGRPPLMLTRFEINSNYIGRTFEDRRDLSMIPEVERGVVIFRSTTPFNMSLQKNDEVRAKFLTIDLINAPEPAKEYNSIMSRDQSMDQYLFNYDRKLS